MNLPDTDPLTAPAAARPDPSRIDRREVLVLSAGLAAASPLAACRSIAPEASAPVVEEEEGEPRDEDELDEALSHLRDRSGDVAPIDSRERTARRERLAGVLSELGVDALLMESCETMDYLTGVRWGRSERLFALVVTAGGEHFWVCPAFETRKAGLAIDAEDGPGGPIVPWDEHEYPHAPLAAELASRGVERVAVEPELRSGFVFRLGEVIGTDRLVSGAETVLLLRGRKDEHELELLRLANELTQQALAVTGELAHEGMTERDVARIVTRAQQRLGLRSVWNLTLSGANAAFPHGSTGQAQIARGDVMLIDTGGALHGYQSDNTRTWAIGGAPSAEFDKVWNAVRDAQVAAYEAIRPGVRCGAVDGAARRSLDAAGYGPGYRLFQHRLGHGIGMKGHEDPYFDGGSEVVLVPGMTLSNEPGVYMYGKFGCRIEDIVVCTEEGADHFGTWQKGPSSPA